MRSYQTGDLVLLTLDSPGAVGITHGLKQLKDRKFRINKIVAINPSGKNPGCRGFYFELKGCESERGIPYAITEDWIMPMKELKR